MKENREVARATNSTAVRVANQENGQEQAAKAKKKINPLNTALVALAIILGLGTAYHLADAVDLGTKLKSLFNNEKELDEEDMTQNISGVVGEETVVPTATPSIGGSFVDNHNQELYIAGLEDIKEVDKGNVVTEQSTKKPGSGSTGGSYSAPSVTTAPQYVNNGNINNGVQNNIYIDNDGNMNIDADQDNTVVPVGPESTVVVPTPAPTQAPTQTPATEEVKYEGYVLRKLNYAEDGRWYTFYFADDQIYVNSDAVEMLDVNMMDANNSNIIAIDDVNSRPGWVFVRNVTAADFASLDSCDNIDAVCDELVSENKTVLGLK